VPDEVKAVVSTKVELSMVFPVMVEVIEQTPNAS
jgi:hypothetical protein